MQKTDDLERAKRLARVIASDISLYNGDKIKRGLENDNIFEELRQEIQEGVAHFQQKVSYEIVNNTNVFERAIIDIVVATRGHIRTPIF